MAAARDFRRGRRGASRGRGVAGSCASLARRFGRLVRDNLRLVIVLAAAAVFVLLLEDVLEDELLALDEAAYALVVEHMRADWLTPVMESFSSLATPVTLLVMLLAVAAFAPGRQPGLCCAVNLGLVVALNQLLKLLVQRPRPEGFRLAEASGYSFPSGHSMAAMAFFGLLIWLVWHYERDRRMRAFLVTAFSLAIVMVGLSRVYLGVHYASDVIAGFCASLIWLVLYTKLVVPLFLDEPKGEGGARTGPSAAA